MRWWRVPAHGEEKRSGGEKRVESGGNCCSEGRREEQDGLIAQEGTQQ